jgi:aminopeptidase-like protein
MGYGRKSDEPPLRNFTYDTLMTSSAFNLRSGSARREPAMGEEIYRLVEQLYPICRSLTGNGQRRTLDILREIIDLSIQEVPSGTQLFDWTVPREWNIRDAYIKDSSGRKIVDFGRSTLHVMSYSVPVHARMSWAALKPHLFTLPERPDWIPYRTSYYREDWGFCLSHRKFLEMKEDEYEVCIDSCLKSGSMTYGEYFVPGERPEEILISCHICHPSLANDNLSGIAVATMLAREISSAPRRYSYRFLFTPGQIGSIAWLCRNERRVGLIRAGLVLACLGDGGSFTYKKSRRGDSLIDRAVPQALRDAGLDYNTLDFSPFGYDERQFCSPGFNLPMGCLMRTPHGCFPEYHTSADDLNFVRPEYLAESLMRCRQILHLLDNERTMINLSPKCEPQLGKRGLYGSIGGASGGRDRELAFLWVLSFSDGEHSLLDIVERSGLPFTAIDMAARELERHGLLKEQL